MNKWILGLSLTVIVAVACIYIFIPSKIVVSSAALVGMSENGTARFLFDENKWGNWWTYKSDDEPVNFNHTRGSFICNEDSFRLAELFHMSANIAIHHQQNTIQSKLLAVSVTTDTTGIQWACTLDAGNNPFTRYRKYLEAKALKKNMDQVLSHFRAFAQKPENIYGISLTRASIKDTVLISAKAVFTQKPHTPDIYKLVSSIQQYIQQKGAKQSGNPIYNITRSDRNQYHLMVAVPTDRILAGDSRFSFKRMIRGSFIISEARGGEYSIEQAQKNLDLFFNDYNKTPMAIDFQMLVTDRLQVADTAQWVTLLYKPVF